MRSLGLLVILLAFFTATADRDLSAQTSKAPVVRKSDSPNDLSGKTIEYQYELVMKVTSGAFFRSTETKTNVVKSKMTFGRNGDIYVFEQNESGAFDDRGHVFKLGQEIDFVQEPSRAHPAVFNISTFSHWRGKISFQRGNLYISNSSNQRMNSSGMEINSDKQHEIAIGADFRTCQVKNFVAKATVSPNTQVETTLGRPISCSISPTTGSTVAATPSDARPAAKEERPPSPTVNGKEIEFWYIQTINIMNGASVVDQNTMRINAKVRVTKSGEVFYFSEDTRGEVFVMNKEVDFLAEPSRGNQRLLAEQTAADLYRGRASLRNNVLSLVVRIDGTDRASGDGRKSQMETELAFSPDLTTCAVTKADLHTQSVSSPSFRAVGSIQGSSGCIIR